MEALEATLFFARKVFCFQIPKLISAEGHKAKDWPKEAFWTGSLRVVSKGDDCFIKLEHADKEGVYLACKVTTKTIEDVADSSRYFVFTAVNDQGRKAQVGLGFKDRPTAFDFRAALRDFYQRNAPPVEVDEKDLEPAAHSIPEGQRITISMGGTSASKPTKEKSAGASAVALPPPPAAAKPTTTTSKPAPAPAPAAAAAADFRFDDGAWDF